MSAVRMVAYGVLENTGSYSKWNGRGPDPQAELRQERDKIRRLVRDELRQHDLLIQPVVRQRHGTGAYRAVENTFMLYGPRNIQDETKSWVTRGVLAEGSFKDCCVAAVEFLEPFNQELSPHASLKE